MCGGSQTISSLSDISFPLLFLESLRATVQVKLLNFQVPIQKTDFDTYYIKRQYFNLPEKLPGDDDICEPSHNIRSITDILLTP